MFRVSKVKLGRAAKQEEKLQRVLGLCCTLYNAALQQRIEAWTKQRVSLSLMDQQKDLTQLRADDEEYRQLPAQMTRATALRRVDLAFKNFFNRKMHRGKVGFPRFKSYKRFSTLIFGKQDWRIDGRKLILNVKSDPIVLHMRNSIHHKGSIKGVHLVHRADRWWADFIVDIGPAPTVKQPCNAVGIDVGLRNFAVLSDGVRIKKPSFMKDSTDKLNAIKRSLQSKMPGSGNRLKLKNALVRMYGKVANKKRNFIQQTAAVLIKHYDGFAVEALDVHEMISTAHVIPDMKGKSIRSMRNNIIDASWAMFIKHLASKAEEAAMPLVYVNPRGTSQRCSRCGTIVHKGLRVRLHTCQTCGLIMDRDENAALNILQESDLECRSAAGSL